MKTYDRLNDFLNSVPAGPPDGITFEIQSAFTKAWSKIHGFTNHGQNFTMYPVIMVCVSGGSDSDVLVDMIERMGHPLSEVHYVFFDTGLEFAATKRHLAFLEQKYGITIERRSAKTPVPLGVKKYGSPFLSKRISNLIGRLQSHGFQWEDRPLDELLQKYPRCQSALRWWCNEWGEGSQVNIRRRRFLKEFLMEHPPDFPISDGCCTGAKKATAHLVEKELKPDLSIQGVRKAEGGARAIAYQSCFDEVLGGPDAFRPIFWFRNNDKAVYTRVFDVPHSDCYEVYGLARTGCSCCPLGRNFEAELIAAQTCEPKLYAAANHVFQKSYQYTRMFHAFAEAKKTE